MLQRALPLLLLALLGCHKNDATTPNTRQVYLESPGGYVPKSKANSTSNSGNNPNKNEDLPPPKRLPRSLLMGGYELAESDPVIDGDSFRIPQLEGDIRLVGVDCEEVFKDEAAKGVADKDFASYVAMMQGKSRLPATYPTPLGEDAKEFAQVFFQFGGKVRLEYDSLARPTDFYGRHLVHLFYESYGQEIHYNVELVKRGYTAYVTKFGRSDRFDKELEAAQAEAKKNKLGIWDPKKKHYPDYEARFQWWATRADAIRKFEQEHRSDPGYIRLDDEDALDRLRTLNGKAAVVFGAVYGVRDEKTPHKMLLAHKDSDDFSLISFEPERFASLAAKQYLGSYVYIRGTVNLFRGQPQMKLEDGATILPQ